MNQVYNVISLGRRKCVLLYGFLSLFLFILLANRAWCDDMSETEMRKELEEMRSKIKELESLKAKIRDFEERLSGKQEVSAGQTVKEEPEARGQDEEKRGTTKLLTISSPYLGNISIGGGLSGGYFAGNNEGIRGTKDNFVLTNLLIDITSEMHSGMFGVNVGLGGVTTPSILGSPDDTVPDFRIEYSSISLRLIKSLQGLVFEGGLLQPNSGYESTYTFDNRNITVGALASQQPYNAVGARAAYSFGEDFRVWGGINKHRLERDEYEIEFEDKNGDSFSKNVQDSYSWEGGVNGSLKEVDLCLYHYHLAGLRHLTGISAEHTIDSLYLALNIDYWRWSEDVERHFEDDSSIGAALYLAPSFHKFSLPLRLEYIRQGKSLIYLDSVDAEDIYAVTLTPTYHFADNVLIRSEISYVRADNGFSNGGGIPKDNKVLFSTEAVVRF